MALKFNPFTGKLDYTGAGGGSPTGPAGGDLTGTYPNPTVDGLQGRPVSNATPYNGQVLQYDGTTWVPGSIPSGGSGGGGVVYYLNFNTAADAPVTNIPQTPNTSKELGIVGDVTGTSYLSPILSTGSYDFLASFVTDVGTPSSTTIPSGIWDFNTFVESTTTNAANQVYFKIEILKYDGTNAPTLLATSNDTYIYDPTEITQYVSSVVMPQTTILSTDRIVVYLYGRAHQNNNRLTFHFGGNYPSHTHSTMPSVTGTGVVKVVNGVFQSPASTIVNSDVSASAAIAVSKLEMSTNRLLGRTTAGTGAVEEITVGTGLSLTGTTLSNTVSAGVTSVTATAPLTSSGGATPDISTSIATNKVVGRSTAGTGVMEELTPVGISVSGGNITGIGGTTGTTDNVVARADGTGGYTVQPSGLIVEDTVISFAVTGDAATDVITATGSAFANDQPVRFTALTGGAGLNTTTNYYVINVSGATFQVSTSIGGSPSLFTTNITAGTLLNAHSVSTNVTLSENTSATNSDLVLTPKGTGALIAGPKPDGTATGGNARGANAVDLQTSRSAATQVASAFAASSILGGTQNTASANYAVVAGGQNGTASGVNSFVGGGQSNTASGGWSCALNSNNTASGQAAFVCGNLNTSSAQDSGSFGANAVADRRTMQAHASGRFADNGDAQRARFVMRNKTTTNAAVELFLDGSSTRLTIPSGKIFAFTINISGVKSDGSAVAHYLRQYCLKNVAGTTSEVYAPVTIGSDNAAGTSIAISANDTNDALKVEVTGITSETWRWVASVDAVEIAYGT